MRGVHLLTHAVARGNLAAVRFLQRFSQSHLGTALAPFMTWQSLLEEELSYVTLEYSVVDSLVEETDIVVNPVRDEDGHCPERYGILR